MMDLATTTESQEQSRSSNLLSGISPTQVGVEVGVNGGSAMFLSRSPQTPNQLSHRYIERDNGFEPSTFSLGS